jgi:3-oxoacyl-[acyl-carrier-protein] synthase III
MTLPGRVARQDAGHSSEIVAAAYAYPSDLVDNDEYLRRCRFKLSTDPEKLAADTRIKTRRWCRPEENTATLVKAAVAKLASSRPELYDQLDVVVVASGTTMPMAHPSDAKNRAFADLAPLVLDQLGRTTAVGLDIKACYCTGFLRGLEVIDGLLGNTNYRYGLLVAAEQGSRFATAETNKSSFCFLAADAAGAVAFRRRERVQGASRAGIVDYCGYTDVSKLGWVGIGQDAASIIMLGSTAAAATREMLIDCAKVLMKRNGLGPDAIDWLLPIQTHGGLVDETVRALDWPAEKVLWFGDANGFSGSASIPSCMAEQIERGTIRKGDLILSLAVGAGMNAAGALYFY